MLCILDCVDYSKSEYKTYRDKRRIMRFIRYSFVEERVGTHALFKIVDKPFSNSFFVNDELKTNIENEQLTGFNFSLVYESPNYTQKDNNK